MIKNCLEAAAAARQITQTARLHMLHVREKDDETRETRNEVSVK
jgi:hypothetical protein